MTEARHVRRSRDDLVGRVADFWTTKIARDQLRLVWDLILSSWRTRATALLDGFVRSFGRAGEMLLPHDRVPYGPLETRELGARWEPDWDRVVGQDQDQTEVWFGRHDLEGPYSRHFMSILHTHDDSVWVEESHPEHPLLFPNSSLVSTSAPHLLQTTWLVQTPSGWGAGAIVSRDGKIMIRGIDYFGGNGIVRTRHHPDQLFSGYLYGLGVSTPNPYLLDFIYPADQAGPALHRFVRQLQTPIVFEAAAAQQAGLVVAEQDTLVIDRVRHPDGSYTYVHEKGTWRVRYRHNPLPIGHLVPQYGNVGDHIRVLHGRAGTVWWRAVDWTGGLDLSQLAPVRDVFAKDQPVRVEVVGQDPDTGKHLVEFWLDGPEDQVALYWHTVRTGERLTGVWMSDLLGLTDPDQVLWINPLEFFFDKLLDSHMVVVVMYLKHVDERARQRALAFLKQHRLSGGTMYLMEPDQTNMLKLNPPVVDSDAGDQVTWPDSSVIYWPEGDPLTWP